MSYFFHLGGRSIKNDNEFHFLGNTELFERPLTCFPILDAMNLVS